MRSTSWQKIWVIRGDFGCFWMILGDCRLKKLMFIGNLPYFTTNWVVVDLFGISSANSICLYCQRRFWGWFWVIVGDIVFYKYPKVFPYF